ncbi:MAG TPA: S16 family serine protease [Jatrophihabitans sp.]|nr:S16 family serine protease [Jatrophihabitans sp.]
MRFDGGRNGWTPPPAAPVAPERRSGRLPFAAVRPDYELIAVNGERLLLDGRPARQPIGRICAVSYRAELQPSAREVLSHLVTRHSAVVSRARITGGRSVEDFEAAGAEDAVWSLASATAAAASLLGQHVREVGGGALVDAVRVDTTGVAERDIVVAVDALPVSTAAELRTALAGRNEAVLTVLRSGADGRPDAPRTVRLHRQPDGAWGIRVVTAHRQLEHGIRAEFDLPADLRGPSLGLSCALSIVDACTGGTLAGGGTVVATGTVDLAGRVGGVGAIEYKARAVAAHPDVRRFVVPAESPEDVEDARRVLGGKAEVVAVTTLAEAVEVLRGLARRSGKLAHRSADRWPGAVMQ